MKIYFKKLYEDSILPTKAHSDDAGYDLFAHSVSTISNGTLDNTVGFKTNEVVGFKTNDIVIYPGSRVLVKCGFNMSMPSDFEAQIRSRSGLALKNGLFVLNSPGTIDSSYSGEIGVIIQNSGPAYQIKFGDRIAQMVIHRLPEIEFVEVDDLPCRGCRSTNGFGSSGK